MVVLASLMLGAAAVMFGGAPTLAQDASGKKMAARVHAGKGEKVCRVRLKYSGELKTWVCKVEEPCCVWHEINYVKCGSPVFKCL
jgi:hypothetical protein